MNLFFLFLLLALPTFSHPESISPHTKERPPTGTLYNFEFEKINSFGYFHSKELKGFPALWILFQPDCKSCEKQFKELNCLPGELPVIAVGFWGSKEKLTATSRRFKRKSELVIAGSEFDRNVTLKQTPTLLITDKHGVVKRKFLSLIPCEAIKQVLNKI